MTPLGWLAVALAVLAGTVPGAAAAAAPARVRILTGTRRLPAPAKRPSRRIRLPAARRLPAAGVIGVLVTALLAGPATAVASALVLGVAALLVRDAARAREVRRRAAELLAAVRLLVAELAAGARPADALRAAAGVAPVYADVLGSAADAAAAGADPGAVLAACPDTRTLGVAWQIADDTGAPPGGVLAHIGRDLLAVQEQRRAVTVALAGPRSSAALLTALPVLGIALGAAMGAAPLSFLFGAGPGRLVLVVGVAFDVAGVAWMRRIVRRAQSGAPP